MTHLKRISELKYRTEEIMQNGTQRNRYKIQKVKITGKKECQVPINFQQKLQKKKNRDQAGGQYLKRYWLKICQHSCEKLNYFLMKNYILRN